MKRGLILFLLLSWPVSAEAIIPIKGSELLFICELEETADSYCLPYIVGVADGYALGNLELKRDSALNICFPRDITGSQQRDVVVKYLKSHPKLARLRSSASNGIIAALLWRFSCDLKNLNRFLVK